MSLKMEEDGRDVSCYFRINQSPHDRVRQILGHAMDKIESLINQSIMTCSSFLM